MCVYIYIYIHMYVNYIIVNSCPWLNPAGPSLPESNPVFKVWAGPSHVASVPPA